MYCVLLHINLGCVDKLPSSVLIPVDARVENAIEQDISDPNLTSMHLLSFRLFKNFSDWHVVDPEKVSAAVPADSGVYEWGCKAQFGKKIVCFYLGKSSKDIQELMITLILMLKMFSCVTKAYLDLH